jgi:hypothetical protein
LAGPCCSAFLFGARRSAEIDCIGFVTAIPACGFAGGSVAKGMKKISYKGYRFPAEIIQPAIWLYLRFTLSFRDVDAKTLITTPHAHVRYAMRYANLCEAATATDVAAC